MTEFRVGRYDVTGMTVAAAVAEAGYEVRR